MSRDTEQTELEKNWKITHEVDNPNECQATDNAFKTSDEVRSVNAEYRQRLRCTSQSLSINGATNFAFNQRDADQVTQLGADHYMIRRRGTKIFVKGFPMADEDNTVDERKSTPISEDLADYTAEPFHSFSSALSGLYAMIMVLIALVIKIAQFVTVDITKVEVHWFFISLYLIAAVWLVSYQPLATSCFREKEKISFDKSSHVNNRWLKGVLVLFGLAIIIKDGLEFIAFLFIDAKICEGRNLFASLAVVHAVFILAQVNYLFKYSKVFTQDFRILTRFGIMHVVATNLSIWISVIVDETALALGVNEGSHDYPEEEITHAPYTSSPEAKQDNLSQASSLSRMHGGSSRASAYQSSGESHSVLFSGNCSCTSKLCSIVDDAEAFLYPFVVEFSLVASCLLYIIWTNIGKSRPIWQHVIKPSYKLYGSYAGVMTGALVAFATILNIVILGSLHSAAQPSDRDYFSEIVFLNIYNGFYIVVETLMGTACLLGFYLFKRIPHNLKKDTEELDTILLMLCLVGPLLYGIFSILSVLVGKENKETAWILSLGFPISDMLQCLIQVMFLLDGLKHEPIASADGQQTAAEIEQSVGHSRDFSTSTEFEDGEEGKMFENDVFTTRAQIPSISTRCRPILRPSAAFVANLASLPGPTLIEEESQNESGEINQVFANNDESFPKQANEETSFSLQTNLTQENSNTAGKTAATSVQPQVKDQVSSHNEFTRRLSTVSNITKFERKIPREKVALQKSNLARASQSALKIVAETKVEAPGRSRLLLRNVTMFLLIANSCLWVFSSLDHTAFVVYLYQSEYYGENVWTIIAMITRPFSIFFRMHSAACLFEVWSFA